MFVYVRDARRSFLARLACLILSWFLVACTFYAPVAAQDAALTAAHVDIAAKDYDKSYVKLKPLTDNGNAVAQYNIGVLYFHVDGALKDFIKTEELWLSAAAQGNADAIRSLTQTLITHGNEKAARATIH